MDVYRIMYRLSPISEWTQHTGGSSTSNGLYTLAGAKNVLGRLTKNRARWATDREYRIERSALYWVDL